MASVNTKRRGVRTHEGHPAVPIDAERQLRRAVMACLLFEDQFYESGQSISDRIKDLVQKVPSDKVAAVMVEARQKMLLRHVPLSMACCLAEKRGLRADHVDAIVQRADEMSELVALWWKDGKRNLPKPVKKGLARAFLRFDEYQLAKYDRAKSVRLRDVAFLCHVKAADNREAASRIARLVNRSFYPSSIQQRYGLIEGYEPLPTPDTWEVGLSEKGADKKQTWERLLSENKLGGLALLRNLRNMHQAGVDLKMIREGLRTMKVARILPFRFIAAARYAPQLEPELEQAMFRCLEGIQKLSGKTALVIDTSGSMFDAKLSDKSDMDRFEAAAALAILAREICEKVNVYAFNNTAHVVPPRRGFALRDALRAAGRGASYGGLAVEQANKDGYDRIIVLTDGQWHTGGYSQGDAVRVSPAPLTGKAYMVNVASYQYGVGYGRWTSIDGFSENILQYVAESEAL